MVTVMVALMVLGKGFELLQHSTPNTAIPGPGWIHSYTIRLNYAVAKAQCRRSPLVAAQPLSQHQRAETAASIRSARLTLLQRDLICRLKGTTCALRNWLVCSRACTLWRYTPGAGVWRAEKASAIACCCEMNARASYARYRRMPFRLLALPDAPQGAKE